VPTRGQIIEVFAGTGYLDYINGFVDRFEESIKYSVAIADELGLKYVLPRSSMAFLEILKENELAKFLSASETIYSSITEAGILYGMEGYSLDQAISFIGSQVDVLGRRVAAEAFTGASMYERAVRSEQYKASGIELYFYDGPNDDRTRDVCLETLGDSRQGTGWTRAEANASSTPMISGGGYNCRHDWLPFVPEADALIEEMKKEAGID
jgi:hypothetical protein